MLGGSSVANSFLTGGWGVGGGGGVVPCRHYRWVKGLHIVLVIFIKVYCTYLQIRTADLSCCVCCGSVLFLV